MFYIKTRNLRRVKRDGIRPGVIRRRMPRRGGGAKGAKGSGRGGKTTTIASRPSAHVCKPAITELPPALQISHVREEASGATVPPFFASAFPEFKKQQAFFSALEKLRPELAGSAHEAGWLGIAPERLSGVERGDSRFAASLRLSDGSTQPVFVKRIHLLDPIRAMEGEYVWPQDGALPAPSDLWKAALKKINEPLNEAYVDALFAACASNLVESGTSPHWCRSFGTFSARVDTYLYNITDEYDSLRRKPWWNRNQRLGLFKYYKDEAAEAAASNFLTEGLTPIDLGDFEEVDVCEGGDVEEPVARAEEPAASLEDPPLQLSTPKLRLSRLDTEDDSSNDSSEYEEGRRSRAGSYNSELEQFAEFHDFPVQVTLLEHAEGTMDVLMEEEYEEEEETKEARWSSWLFQVIAGLVVAQHYYGFVHNDLHTNNVMWSSTDQEFLYYRVTKGREVFYMKVPTHGKLMKIIDFGRASYHLPEPAGFFISDAFFPGNDAAEQYNCEPFYDKEDGKVVEPNRSFDLARLSVSLIDALFPERPEAVKPVRIMSKEPGKMYTETVSAVYNLLWEWLQDDEGKNILRLPDGEERYPDFDLYRALAADIHRAIPARQIEKTLFSGYRIESVPEGATIYDLVL